MIDALYRSLGSLRAWVTFIIGAVAATATWRSPSRANAAAPLGAASSSLSHRKHTLPLLALLAAAALGLALLLPGGVLQAQSDAIEYPENGTDPVATFTAADPEGATPVTWALAADSDLGSGGAPAVTANADAADFEIDEDGVLKFNIDAANDGSSAGSPDFENPQGAGATANNTYNVVVKATDAGGAPGYYEVTVKVTDEDETGKMSWTVTDGDGLSNPTLVQLQVGAVLAASATDGDIAGATKDVLEATTGVTAPIWRWYRGSTLIEDATSASYTVGLADVGHHLRVVARYVVGDNVSQETASLTSDYPVLAERVGDHKLKFDPATVSRSVAEGKKGANVGAPVTATGNHGAINYALAASGDASTGSEKFKIDAKTGQITTAVDLNFESSDGAADNCASANTCQVTVTATDASGEAAAPAATVNIKITDVDEAPDFDTGTAGALMAVTAITVPENKTDLFNTDTTSAFSANAQTEVTYRAADPETRNIVYSLMGPDAARFEFSSSRVLSFVQKPDYENPGDANRDNVYEVTVRASDGTLHADRMVKVTVIGVDEAPVVTGVDSVNYAENGAGNVATFTAADPEGATSVTWALAADSDLGSGGAPAVTANADAADFEIDEDGVLKFNIDAANDGSSAGSPDFENPQGAGTTANNTYNVVVKATDAGGASGYHAVTVKVTDVNETGKMSWTVTDGDGLSNPTLVQLQVGAVLAASATDGDIAGATKDVLEATTGVRDVIWRWYRGSTLIEDATSASYTVGLADRGHRLRVVVRYIVGDNVSHEPASLTSDYPVLAERVGDHKLKFDPATVSRSVAEGKKGANVGAPVTATGNHGAINYALAASGDASTGSEKFKIDAKTGQITTAVDLNFESSDGAADNCASANACQVTVTATDASGEAAAPAATVNIKITDVDEAPTFITDSTGPPAAASPETITVPENETDLFNTDTASAFSVNTEVGVTYAATDQDGLNVNLSLMGPDAADFSLSATGVLSFAKKPDYENPADANRDNLYEVTVRASDGTMTADRMVRVTVENVNEPPAIIAGGLVVSGPANPSVPENTPVTTAVATYTAAGPDAASAMWSLSGADAGDFTLSNIGVLNFRTSPNFENPADANTDNVYEVTVTANDGENTVMRDVTVTVTDVEEQGTGDALVDRYDANSNSAIEKGEVIAAINDYLDDGANAPTKADVIRLINLYLDS